MILLQDLTIYIQQVLTGIKWIFPDLTKIFPDLTKTFQKLTKILQDLTKIFQDPTKIFQELTKDLTGSFILQISCMFYKNITGTGYCQDLSGSYQDTKSFLQRSCRILTRIYM